MLKVIRSFQQFSTFTHKLNLDYLRKLQLVLGSNFKINEDITYVDNVRLIDKNNKFIGVLSMDEARRKANATQQDLILINPDVQPAVCRLMDYSEELGRKFMKEILVTDQDKREKMLWRQTKLLKLGSKISIQDLKVKSNMAKDLLKKAKQIRMQIICEVDQVAQSQNIMMTFRDLTTSFMTPMSEIRVKDLELKDDLFSKVEVEPKKVVEWIFRSLEVQFQKQEEYSFEDIKKEIDIHYNRVKSKKYVVSLEDIQQAKTDFSEYQDDDEDLQSELMSIVNKKFVTKSKKTKLIQKEDQDQDLMSILRMNELQVENEFKDYRDLKVEHGEGIILKMLKDSEQLDDRNTYRLIRVLQKARSQKL